MIINKKTINKQMKKQEMKYNIKYYNCKTQNTYQQLKTLWAPNNQVSLHITHCI